MNNKMAVVLAHFGHFGGRGAVGGLLVAAALLVIAACVISGRKDAK